jgi:hypothetical protein
MGDLLSGFFIMGGLLSVFLLSVFAKLKTLLSNIHDEVMASDTGTQTQS